MIALTSLMVVLSAAPEVQQLTLDNGMTWLIVERHEAPVFTGFVRVRVGGADERPGITGLAHLFEHMAFKGTPRLGAKDWAAEQQLLPQIEEVGDELARADRSGRVSPEARKVLADRLAALEKQHAALFDENALARLYQVNGGVGLNATTDKDVTSYFVSLPSNRVELWLTIEAQRFAAPVLRDFYTERSVVQEERLRSIETNPSGLVWEELMHTAFVTSPYRWPTVGYAGDLKTMELSEARAFFDRHYVASNAVGCIVGDVDAKTLKPLLERTFGSLPKRPRPASPQFTEPAFRAQRRSQLTFDAAPRIMLAFHKPAPPSREDAVFDVLRTVLTEGNGSRLQQRLVFKDKLAQGVGAYNAPPGVRFDNLLTISVVPLAGVKLETVEAAVWDELQRLTTELVSPAELEKVQRRISTDLLRSLDSNSGAAGALSRAQVLYDDWRYPFELPKVIESITAEELRQVAKKTFVKENSVVVTQVRP